MSTPHEQQLHISDNMSGDAGSPGAYASGENKYVLIQEVDTSTAFSRSINLSTLFPDKFTDSGVVEVKNVYVTYKGTAAGQEVNCGIVNINSSASAAAIGLTEFGHSFTCTDYNIGAKTMTELPVPDRLSRRVRGGDIKGMPAKLVVSCSAAMKLIITWHLILFGPEISYETLN